MKKDRGKINVANSISVLFLFFSFFPYLKIVETGSDLQPLSFLIGTLYLLSRLKTLQVNNRILYVLYSLIFVILFFSLEVIVRFDIVLFRGLYSYMSIFIHSLAAYDILKRRPQYLFKVIEWSIYIWFAVGFIQNYFFPSFLTFLLSRGGGYDAANAGGRGVISLAVEPTFYGLQCLFLLLFVLLIKSCKDCYSSKKSYFLIVLCLVQIIVFAKSSMVILILLLLVMAVVLTYFFKKPLYAIFSVIALVGIFIGAIFILKEDSRIIILGNLFIEAPSEILLIDRSINERVSDIYYSLQGFISNPIGHGLNGWQSFLGSQPNSPIFVKNEQARIMSFLGSFLFEIGIFSSFLIYYIYLGVRKYLELVKIKNFTMYIVVTMILLTAIQSSYPPIWILLTASIVFANERKDRYRTSVNNVVY